ncbi:unnamed protein product, partial [Darwinula stevensoni]
MTQEKMPVPVGGGYSGPSCWDRVKLGFTIGFCVGMASGALFGGFTALRYGLRGRELVNNLGKVMLQGGGTFGTFMAIGTVRLQRMQTPNRLDDYEWPEEWRRKVIVYSICAGMTNNDIVDKRIRKQLVDSDFDVEAMAARKTQDRAEQR